MLKAAFSVTLEVMKYCTLTHKEWHYRKKRNSGLRMGIASNDFALAQWTRTFQVPVFWWPTVHLVNCPTDASRESVPVSWGIWTRSTSSGANISIGPKTSTASPRLLILVHFGEELTALISKISWRELSRLQGDRLCISLTKQYKPHNMGKLLDRPWEM